MSCGAAEGLLSAASDWAPVIGWVIVVVGWIFASRDHNKRERRKELRATVTALIGRVRDCEERGIKYWLLPGDDSECLTLATSIKLDLQRISRERHRIKKELKDLCCDDEIITFRKVLTGADFDSPYRAALAPGNSRILHISQSAIDLIDSLEEGFSKSF